MWGGVFVRTRNHRMLVRIIEFNARSSLHVRRVSRFTWALWVLNGGRLKLVPQNIPGSNASRTTSPPGPWRPRFTLQPCLSASTMLECWRPGSVIVMFFVP